MLSVAHLREIGLLAHQPLVASGRPVVPAAAPAAPAAAAASTAPVASSSTAASASPSAPAAPAAPTAPTVPATASTTAPTPAPSPELSAAELAKLSKEERKAYHLARRPQVAANAAGGGKQLSKAERRAVQEAQRKAKEDKREADVDAQEMLADLRLQGLSEEQAKEVLSELARAEEQGEDEEDDAPEDLLGCVRKWMGEQEQKLPEDVLHDFNMKVRFQGHVDTTPPDHLGAILHILAQEAGQRCQEKKPAAVAKAAEPEFARWAPLLEPLYRKIDDPLSAADAVVSSVLAGAEGVPEAAVGCLMAAREVEIMEDEDLLTGCKRAEPRSRVMDRFIEFLEEELEEEEGDEDDDD